jgi:predicted alpha/beta hydrolase
MTEAARRQRPRQWTRRNAAPPRASFEEIEIHTADGVALRAVMDDPPQGVALEGTCVLGHAMFARKTSFGRRDRPGLAQALAAAGFRTIAFDFRGHGDSVLPVGSADYGYDDFVRFDLPAVVSAARARADEQPVIVVGHSLGGHVALASQGAKLLDADAIVGLAANVWHPALERSLVRRALKRVIASASVRAAARIGRVPARALRLGSDDASVRYIDDLFRITRRATWRSTDGKDDYLAALATVTIPVANVVGKGDRLMCHPDAGEAFLKRCAGPTALFSAPAGHMDLVTSSRHHGVVLDAVRWAAMEAKR